MPQTYQTPGVYIQELNAFPNSIVEVATAIPAFIGYTPQASYNGRSYTNQPVMLDSFQDFLAYFAKKNPGNGGPPTVAPYKNQCQPVYYCTAVAKTETSGDLEIAGTQYNVEPDPSTIYYLYNCIKLFYQNGGGRCCVISVGSYGKASGKPRVKSEALINSNVKLTDLQGGLDALTQEQEPTLIVIPDALLLKADENGTLMKSVLEHCHLVQSRVGLFDIQGGERPNPVTWSKDNIDPFRTATGMNHLNYGIAYYPFLNTTVVDDDGIDFMNLGPPGALTTLLPSDSAVVKLVTLAKSAADATGKPSTTSPAKNDTQRPDQIEAALRVASKTYMQIHDVVLRKINILPPSAAMAGVYTMVDNDSGVWVAPANVTLTAVTDVTLDVTDITQAGLNVDAATGKSINAIRVFPGKGAVVWGARTLDGNSQDWRYVNVRRTLIMIEQSMKLGANAYVFAPNESNTWSLITSMLNNFLTNLWKRGALVGASPAEAFSVSVGLGKTMTAQDILDGVMNISVKVAVSHPAEFIVITIQQQMQTS